MEKYMKVWYGSIRQTSRLLGKVSKCHVKSASVKLISIIPFFCNFNLF